MAFSASQVVAETGAWVPVLAWEAAEEEGVHASSVEEWEVEA
jgi:hypothetical protein